MIRATRRKHLVKSHLVVISWWSNCLGLACLHNLASYICDRNLYVVQVGKPEAQKEWFRHLMPSQVQELFYPDSEGTEDWRVRETVARHLLDQEEGLWFIDHDLFVVESCEAWFTEMDRRFENADVCFCHALPGHGPSVTNPAFWLSPTRFPPGTPSFARLPVCEEPIVGRPYAVCDTIPPLMLPEKDTLVAAMEFWQKKDLVCGFPLRARDYVAGGLPLFPEHEHIGGLATFASALPPPGLWGWVSRCVIQFEAFYAMCPPEWAATEEPVLLARLAEFRQAICGHRPMTQGFS
jgi:hypothetical protein